MDLAELDYDLPAGAIAQEPIEPRSAARLLVAGVTPGAELAHRQVADLPTLLGPGDLVVVNESRVVPARLALRKPTGGHVEVLLLEADETGSGWAALVRPSRRVAPGTILLAGEAPVVEVGERLAGGRRRVRMLGGGGAPVPAPAGHATIALPPYIRCPLADIERYQTVYATRPGSVAAPTAGLHLTHDVLDACRAVGAGVATVDLAVGLDTFRPITVARVEDHQMHSERYSVPPATLDACRQARRVVAVGTTTLRALESAAVGPAQGRTRLFITPGYPFAAVDLLLTNLHQPRSSLLVLLAAFYGPAWRALYTTALAEGYRFLSFGDAMLVPRRQ